jgi:dihydrofolate reductase
VSKLRVNSYSVSLDGYGAGPNQSLEDPLGVNGEKVHRWMFGTRTFSQLYGNGKGSTGVDDQFAQRCFANLGSWILGRNMFAASRGPWPDDGWKGWWGDEPPYHCDVFVLTHHAREPITMKGGTTLYFVTDGIEAALERARKAAAGKDVRLGGGASLIRQYLQARLIDEMHIAFSPVLLGSGEAPFVGINLLELGYKVAEHVATDAATHVVFTRSAA